MFTQAEIEYIQKQFARGLTADAITNKLVETGWDKDDIADGLKEVERLASLSPAQSPIKIEENKVIPENKIIEEKIEESTTSPIIGLETKEGPSVVSLEKESIFPSANRPVEPRAILKVFVGLILSLLILGAIGFAYYQFFYKPNTKELITLEPEASDISSSTNQDVPSDLPTDESNTSDAGILPGVNTDNLGQPVLTSTGTNQIIEPQSDLPFVPNIVTPSVNGQISNSSSTFSTSTNSN